MLSGDYNEEVDDCMRDTDVQVTRARVLRNAYVCFVLWETVTLVFKLWFGVFFGTAVGKSKHKTTALFIFLLTSVLGYVYTVT